MEYQKFKAVIVEELQKSYQEEAEVKISIVVKNNGRSYEGIQITFKTELRKPVPMIDLNYYFEKYKMGEGNLMECVENIIKERKKHSCPNWLEEFAGKVTDWEYVKEHVYLVLLPTKENQKMLENLVSKPFLDLSIIYIIREDSLGEWRGSARITKKMQEYYGVSKEQLHYQALENIKKDGYEFRDMKEILKKLPFALEMEEEPEDTGMYVLTNASKLYGAAGILDFDLLKQFAENRDFYILPSSLHEWIFVPVVDMDEKEVLDKMVKEVNAEVVNAEDRLSDHCYYYDAKENKIRMCA